MKKKNKLLVLLVLLIGLIIICRRVLVFESINYKLSIDGSKIKIKEVYNKNYYIEINTGKHIYPIRIYENLNEKRKIVKDIYFYKDDTIECVLPIINNKTYTDIMCYQDEILRDYHNIIGENLKLDKYVDSINLYNINQYNKEPSSKKTIGSIKYNLHDNFTNSIAITTYNGIVIDGEEIKLFENDVYSNKISTFINNYYVVADYDNKYSFNYFYIVDLKTKEVNKLKSKEDISYDSYIQGIVDNKIYVYDIDNENQHEIDMEKRSINVISSDKYVKYYSNKKWEKMNKVKANKEILFDYKVLDNNFTKYDYVKESENYYYLFKKDGIFYKLYRVDKKNTEVYKFIFEVPVTNLFYNDNYIYYTYKNKLYYYNDITGLKVVLENSELEFNNTIKYYIY